MRKKNLWSMMVIFMAAMLSVSFSSCSKDDDDSSEDAPKSITLQVFFNGSHSNAYPCSFLIYEYSEDNERVGNHTFDVVSQYQSVSYSMSSKTTKVKIYYESNGKVDKAGWIQTVYYLENGRTDITLQGWIVGPQEPGESSSTNTSNTFSIVGKWKKESDNSTTYYEFTSNNQCFKAKIYKNASQNSYTESYTYSFDSSSNILIIYENGSIKEEEKVIVYSNNQISFDDDIFYRVE